MTRRPVDKVWLGAGAVLVVLVGLAVGVAPVPALSAIGVVAGVAFMVCLGCRRPEAFALLMMGSVFLSRFGFDVAGFRWRLEMLVGISAVVCLAYRGLGDLTRRNVLVILTFFSWTVWLAVVTFANAPEPARSIPVIAWLVLDLCMLVYFAGHVRDYKRLVTFGIWAALGTGTAGILLWALATTSTMRILVQPDPTYGGFAAYVTVFEANILASLVVLWAAIASMPRLAGHVSIWARVFLIVCCPVLAIATHTRIALVASILVILLAVIAARSVVLAVATGLVSGVVVFLFSRVNLAAVDLQKFSQPLSLDEGTGRYRDLVWTQAFSDLQEGAPSSWLFGLGANSFGQRHYDPSLPGQGVPWYLGNLPLQLIYDGGFVAVGLLAIAVLLLVWGRLSFGVIGFGLVYLLFSISTSTLWLFQSWTFVAVAMVFWKAGLRNVESSGRGQAGSDDWVSGSCRAPSNIRV